ncbi:MAG: DUF3137 domain-containing protein [Deinococcota bacterium]
MKKDVADFHNFYTEDLHDTLVELEKLRIRARNIFRLIASIILALTVSLLFTLFATNYEPEVRPALTLVILIAAGFLILFSISETGSGKVFRQQFKHQIIGPFVEFIDKDLRFDFESYIPQSVFLDSCLFSSNIKHYRGDSHICGKMSGRTFECSKLLVKSDSVSNKHSLVFSGLFFAIELDNPTHATTLIYPRIKSRPSSKVYKRAKLEDPSFEESFNVYADDQVEARVQLTMSVMESIFHFGEHFVEKPYLSFKNKTLYIAVPSISYLEPSYLRSLLDTQSQYQLIKDFELVVSTLSIIEALKA